MCPDLECHKYSMTLGWGLWTWHGASVGLCLARSLWKIQSSKRVALFGNKMSHISLISINWSLDFSLAPYQLDQMVGTQGHYISCCGCAVWHTLCHSTCNLLNPTQSAWVDVSTGSSYNLCNYLGVKHYGFGSDHCQLRLLKSNLATCSYQTKRFHFSFFLSDEKLDKWDEWANHLAILYQQYLTSAICASTVALDFILQIVISPGLWS